MAVRIAVYPKQAATDRDVWLEDIGLIRLSQSPRLLRYADFPEPAAEYQRSLVLYDFPDFVRDGRNAVSADDMQDLSACVAEKVQETWGAEFRDYRLEFLPPEEMLRRIQINDVEMGDALPKGAIPSIHMSLPSSYADILNKRILIPQQYPHNYVSFLDGRLRKEYVSWKRELFELQFAEALSFLMFRHLRNELGDAYIKSLPKVSPVFLRSIVSIDTALTTLANTRCFSDCEHSIPLLAGRHALLWSPHHALGGSEPLIRNAYKTVLALGGEYPIAKICLADGFQPLMIGEGGTQRLSTGLLFFTGHPTCDERMQPFSDLLTEQLFGDDTLRPLQ